MKRFLIKMYFKDIERGNVGLIVLLSVFFVAVTILAFFYFLRSPDKKEPELNVSKPIQTPPRSRPSDARDTSQYPIVKEVTSGECTNNAIGLSITLPNGWSCESEQRSVLDGWISVRSKFFTINISNGGRGPYCGGGPVTANTDDTCRTRKFITNDKVDLDIYTYKGEDKEIWGGVVPLNKLGSHANTWVSVMYPDIEKQKLTTNQRAELLSFFNTIKVVNKIYTSPSTAGTLLKVSFEYPVNWDVSEGKQYSANSPSPYMMMATPNKSLTTENIDLIDLQKIEVSYTPEIYLKEAGSSYIDTKITTFLGKPAFIGLYSWSKMAEQIEEILFNDNGNTYIVTVRYKNSYKNINSLPKMNPDILNSLRILE